MSSTASDRLSHFLGVGLLLGMALLFAAYLWNARESHAVHPVDVVLRHSPPHGAVTSIEIVPYQHEHEPAEPQCPIAPAAELCLIIGPGNATPDSMTFT
jgi:hypothetical protein